jgi:exonuclease SbcD
MFKFIHAADVHLDSPMHRLDYYEGAPLEDLRQATRRALQNLVELAIGEGVSFVLIAGDLYDGDWKDYNTALYFVSQMSRLRESGIPAFIIAGNHDAASKITKALRLPDGVKLFSAEAPETVRLETKGVALHGQSFASPAVRRNLATSYPLPLPGFFNIGLLHTSVTGREGHEAYAPCTIMDLESKGYDYWALGHVHAREVVLEHPMVVFPGNVQGRHVKEIGPKGCILVSVDDHGVPDAAFRPLDVIRWCKLEADASGLDSGYDVVGRVEQGLLELLDQNDGLPLIVRVEVTGECRAHNEIASDPERWANEIRSSALDSGGGCIWIEKVRLQTSLPTDHSEGSPASGPVGELLTYLEDLATSAEQLKALAGSLADLRRALPRELKEGPEAIPFDDEKWLLDLLEQIRPMLLRRLMKRGD